MVLIGLPEAFRRASWAHYSSDSKVHVVHCSTETSRDQYHSGCSRAYETRDALHRCFIDKLEPVVGLSHDEYFPQRRKILNIPGTLANNVLRDWTLVENVIRVAVFGPEHGCLYF